MKLQSILAAAAFALSAGLALGANAASDTSAGAQADKAPAEKMAKKKMRQHSHMEEKTGMRATPSEEPAKPAKDVHSHQRDAK